MLIRQVLHNGDTNKWAYVEYSGSGNHFVILGDKEFDTEEEALEFKKGFSICSYTWVDPEERRVEHYLNTRERLIAEIKALDETAGYGPLQQEIEQAADNYADLQDSAWVNDYNGFMAGAKYVMDKYGIS